LNIETIRYTDKLRVEYNVDESLIDYSIPIFLIFGLIENALKHGMQTSPMPLSVFVRIGKTDDRLCIEITNSGHWIEPQIKPDRNSTYSGLTNIQQRLQHFYPGKHTFEVVKGTDSVRIRITIWDEKMKHA